MIGQRFGRWLIIGQAAEKNKQKYWVCHCDCGTERNVAQHTLLSGESKSCRCRFKDFPSQLRHGHTRHKQDTAEYRTWRSMMRRCYTKTDQKYPRYGGRGIKVCERWQTFEYFLADMGLRPKHQTIDRFPNNDGDYEPTNCRWATPKEQARNSSTVRLVEVDGETRPLVEIIDEKGLNYNVIVSRIKRGWNAQEAVYGRVILRSL